MSRNRYKMTDDTITEKFLSERADGLANAGYAKPKWIIFCELLLRNGYSLTLYEARQTFSKYITVRKEGFKPFKVRFSNHKPIEHRELSGDCDFFVGITHKDTTNTNDALAAVERHFNSTTKETAHG